jgi:hypothetical protein
MGIIGALQRQGSVPEPGHSQAGDAAESHPSKNEGSGTRLDTVGYNLTSFPTQTVWQEVFALADYPYHVNPPNLRKFLEHIQTSGVPSKVTIQYIESVGFKSKNDRAILAVLKAIGFVEESGAPSSLWKAYRNKSQAKVVVATALRKAYANLFTTYPNAHQKDNEALRNFFSSHTEVGETTLAYMVRTFKTLAEMADFESSTGQQKEETVEAELDEQGEDVVVKRQQRSGAGMTVNINIQLQLPATDNAAIYENLFAALKKNLLS